MEYKGFAPFSMVCRKYDWFSCAIAPRLHAPASSKRAENPVNRSHSISLVYVYNFPKVAAKVRILPKFNERNALRK